MVQVHFNTAFAGMKPEVLRTNRYTYRAQLVGSAIFTQNDSLTSKIVRWAESWRCKEGGFIPSHTGSIIEYNDDLYIFDMKPMRASVQPLYDYLLNTDDKYAIVLRNFNLDTKMFSLNVAEHIGEFYPIFISNKKCFYQKTN